MEYKQFLKLSNKVKRVEGDLSLREKELLEANKTIVALQDKVEILEGKVGVIELKAGVK